MRKVIKKFSIVLCFVLILFSMNNLSIVRATDYITKSASGTNLSSFPSPYIPSEKVDSSTIYEDMYEFNDNYDEAINLCPSDYYDLNLYRTKIEATLDYDVGYNDIDYYYFKILTDSYVTITINSQNSGLYDFYVLTNEYYNTDYYNAYHGINGLLYDETSNTYRTFLNIVNPGTFYIYVRGKQTTNLEIEYELNLYIEKKLGYINRDLDDLKEISGLKGVAWISDFVPLGLDLVFDLTDEVKYYQNNITNLCYEDHALDDMKLLYDNNIIPLATYYIWDPLLRYDLNAICKTFSQMLHEEYKEEEQLTMDLEIVRDSVTGIIQIVGTIIGYKSGISTGTKSIAKEIIGEFISWDNIMIESLNLIFDYMVPKMTLEKADFLAFMSCLTVALEIDVSDITSRSEIARMEKNEEIYIPIFYKIFEEYGIKYLSLSATLDNFYNTLDMEYDGNLLYYNENIYTRGKHYAISEVEHMSQLSSLTNIDDLHTHNYSYVWKNLTKHDALCSCGDIKSEGHAVLNGSDICIRCGGKANVSFVEIMNNITYKTVNGSYKLANGVIVLVEEDLQDYYNETIIFYESNELLAIS